MRGTFPCSVKGLKHQAFPFFYGYSYEKNAQNNCITLHSELNYVVKKLVIMLFILSFFAGQHTHNTRGKTDLAIDYYIEMSPWKKVDELLPRKSVFTVIDVETGKRFKVQRRAGSKHADVQPMTFKDTKIMKNIYGGSWSWKRRAVLVYSNDLLIAASMHGMPHGAGALKNGFPGHFCIHFSGSSTHKTGKPDLSHHLMILKAGGKLEPFLNGLPPRPVLDAFLAGIKNNDKQLVRKAGTSGIANLEFVDKVEALKWSINSAGKDDQQSLVSTIKVDVQLFIKDTGPLNTNLTFKVVRTSPTSPWKVDGSPLFKLLR
jgi:hypothetical protein